MAVRRLRPVVAVLVAVLVGAIALAVPPAAAEDVLPTITLHPVSATAVSQQNLTLTADASPYTSVRWQWRSPGGTWANVSGATSATFTTTYSGTREVRAVFTNGTASATTDVALVTYYLAPVFTAFPQPITKAPGTITALTASYTCTCASPATGTWQRSTDGGATWISLPGGTVWPSPARYPFDPLTLDDGGLYRVTVIDAPASPRTSGSALVSFDHAPRFLTITGSTQGPEGSVQTLTASVEGGYPAATLQWQEQLAGGTTWSDLEGETGTTLARTLTADLHGRKVRAMATNPTGTVYSTSTKTYLVGTVPTASLVSVTGNYRTYGDEIELVSTGEGLPAPTISWKFKPYRSSVFTTIPGLTDPNHSFTLSPETEGTYEVTYTNQVAATKATVRVFQPHAGKLVVTPTARTLSVGQYLGSAFVGTQPTYPDPYSAAQPEWERSLDGGVTWELLGNGFPNINLVGAPELDGALYRRTITTEYGTAKSNVAVLTVVSSPGVSTQPVQQKVAIGATATFTAAAKGSPAPTVQWQRSNDGGTSWADIDGATATTYTFTTALADDSSRYRAVFTNVHGSAASDAALLRVGFPTGTLVEDQPYVYGSTLATFSIADVTGSPAPTITWYRFWSGGCVECFGTVEVGSGPTASFGMGSSGPGYGGYHYVEIKNSIGTLTLYPSPRQASAPVVTASPESVTAAPGSEVTFSAAASGTPAPAVQWERSVGNTAWAEIEGATSGSLTVTVPSDGPELRYRARFTNLADTAFSGVATLQRDGSVPVVSAVLSSASEPVGGAYGGPVTVLLEAMDDRAVESITWSSSGAIVAGPTTVAGATAGLVVDAVGTSTISFTARDASGNVSELQTVEVTIVGSPGSVSGLKAGLGDGSSVVSWNAPAAASVVTGYRITPFVGNVAQAPQVFGAGTSATVTGLTNGVTYTFRVAAINAWGTGPVAVTVPTTIGVASHPSSLRSFPGDGQVRLTWLSPPDMGVAPSGYRITPYLGSTALAPVEVGAVNEATITGLVNGSTYTFRIVTLTPHGASVFATFSAVSIGVPRYPSPLRTFPGNGEVRLTWATPPFMGIAPTGYRITPYLGSTALAPTEVGVVNEATITGLTNGSTYTFRIVTLSANGPSAFASFPPTLIGAPGTPTSQRAIAGNGEARVLWATPPFMGVPPTGYRITPYLGSTALAPTEVGVVNEATITGLTNGSTYTFRIQTLSANGTSGPAVTPAVTIGVPSHPSSLRAFAGPGEARLTWSPPPFMGVAPTGYRITPYLGSVAQAPVEVGAVNTTTITGLTPGATYTFRIVTLSPFGASIFATFPPVTILSP